MAFERIEKNLTLLRSQTQISAEDLVDSMNRLLSDSEEFNKEHGISEFQAKEIEQYSLDLQDLLIMLNHTFSLHRDQLESLDDEYLRKIHKDSLKVQNDIDAKKPILEKLSSEKETRNGLITEAASLQGQIDQLERELAGLEDISLEDLKQKRDELKKKKDDLEGRQSEYKELNKDIGGLEAQLSKVKSDLKDLQGKKDTIIKDEAETGKLVEEYKAWIEDHGKNDSSIRTDYNEAKNAFAVITNAWTAIKQRDDFEEVINSLEDSALHEIKSFSDLDMWFDHMNKQLVIMLDSYRDMYNGVLLVINRGGTK